MKRVGVIIPCHNYARFLAKSIESVMTQGWENLQVVVVDDGSTDETALVAASYPEVDYVHQENGGVVSAINTGISWLHPPDYIATNSADDEWAPGRLARQVEAMENDPGIGMLYGGMELISEDGTVTGEYPVPDVPQEAVLDHLLSLNFVSGGTTLTRASLLPLFYPIPPVACYEDWWMAVRIASRGVRIERLPGPPVLRYRMHGANMTAAPENEMREREREFRRWLLDEGLAGLVSMEARAAAERALVE